MTIYNFLYNMDLFGKIAKINLHPGQIVSIQKLTNVYQYRNSLLQKNEKQVIQKSGYSGH